MNNQNETRTTYGTGTPSLVVDALERARSNGQRVRLFYGDNVTGQDWHEENDVTGTVGRSCGSIRVPLLLANTRSSGGGPISTENIVRLIVDGREVYRHANYKQGVFTVREIGKLDECGKLNLSRAGYTHAVDIGGENTANFKSFAQALRWVRFMQGERATK
jgi:hypothetical protein